MPPVPRVAVGIILAVLGLALCLFGSQFIKVIFGVIATLSISFLILAILLQLFRKDFSSIIGAVLFGVSFVAAIPLAYKAAQLANIYAVPFFSGLIAYTIMALTCELAHV